MGTHELVLSESYPMNTNITGFIWFSKISVLVLWMKVAIALKGLYSYAAGDNFHSVNDTHGTRK